MPTLRLAAATVLAFALLASPAAAGDPIMPLSQVTAGMRCVGYSVVHGTEPVPFAVDVIDVIDADPVIGEARILVGVSGAAIEGTGVGPGFSGSPIYCPDGAGVQRVIGAIAESIGDYGGDVVLARPIKDILAVPTRAPRPAAAARRASGGGVRLVGRAGTRLRGRVRPLAGPLVVSGLSGPLGQALGAAARRAGRAVIAGPARPAASFPVQRLRPGSAMVAGLSSGDVALGALGTVAYVDGDRVWGFGHPFDNAGARALLLQDAYIFGVIGNPNPPGLETEGTYKYGSPGHAIGTVSDDANAAVAGTMGGLPPTIPVRVRVRDADTGRRVTVNVRVADETDVGTPGGSSALPFIAPLAVAQAAERALGSAPGKLAGRMCVRIALREVRKPAGFCNRYVSMGGGETDSGFVDVVAERAGSDLSDALGVVDKFKLGVLHVRRVDVRMTVRRGTFQAYVRRVRAPARVRAGRRVRLTVTLRRVHGPRERRRVSVRIPRGIGTGMRTLRLAGTDVDMVGGGLFDLIVIGLEGDLPEDEPDDDAGPAGRKQVVRQIRRVRRFDGVRLTITRAPARGSGRFVDGDSGKTVRAFRHPRWRVSGVATTRVRVVR